jgi:hypothetical protein
MESQWISGGREFALKRAKLLQFLLGDLSGLPYKICLIQAHSKVIQTVNSDHK